MDFGSTLESVTEVINSLEETYPEVDIEISSTAKFPVTHLEGNGHLVVYVQHLVEAFPPMRGQLDIVCKSSS